MLKQAYSDNKIQTLLPNGYESRLTPQEKIAMAKELAEKVEKKYNLNIVAASIIGSSLRGVDRPESDTDFLFLTDNNIKKAKTVNIDDNDSQVQNVFKYAQILPTSIPYVEFRQSPFLLVNDMFRAFILGQKANKVTLLQHGTAFFEHVIERKVTKPTKALVNTMCAVNLLYNGNALVARKELSTTSDLALFTKEILLRDNMLSPKLSDLFENNVPLV